MNADTRGEGRCAIGKGNKKNAKSKAKAQEKKKTEERRTKAAGLSPKKRGK